MKIPCIESLQPPGYIYPLSLSLFYFPSSLSLRRHAHGPLAKRSITFRLETKMPWRQNPLTKEESRRVYNCDDKRLLGSTKCWIFRSIWKYMKYLKFAA